MAGGRVIISIYVVKRSAKRRGAVACNDRAYDIITRIMRNKPGVEDESDAA
ncbi:hypothetical protein PEC302110_31700 [Pectobacterium araliae]|uniref:Uncharacterized protein n=1 Tax=Pectobacterium araliae TaxID=3073862 RepID=A0AAN0MMD7_9GAMM|nr:hypothetical protein PEC302110_31700 [Pectobacterium sp. MAFF 302110]